MSTFPMGVTVLANGPCADCAHGQGDCRDVQISEIRVGSTPGTRVWCLNCGAYFDVCFDGFPTVADFGPYRQGSA